jgi:ferredoxin-NADP reductase
MQLFPGTQELLIRQMTWEAEDVISLTLVRGDGAELPEWTLGAHVDVMLTPEMIRQYSLCSDPSNRYEWKIAILHEPNGGGGSRYIHESLRPGMALAVAEPRNNFPLADAEHYLFIAGGIGVTPLIPMVHEVAGRGADWKLLYGGRRRASMAFVSMLGELGEQVTVCPQDEYGLLDLKQSIESMPSDTGIYCCGPEPLIAAVEAQCAASSRLPPHVERFHARPGFAAEQAGSDVEVTEFELVLNSSGLRFTVPEDKTIIEVLEAARIFVPTSCTEGYCGVCETEVVSGIPDHRDDYMTPEKRATNKTMMICVGRSKTAELVLKL